MSAAWRQWSPCDFIGGQLTGGGRCREAGHVERDTQLELDVPGVEKAAGVFGGERSGYRSRDVEDVSLSLRSAAVAKFR